LVGCFRNEEFNSVVLLMELDEAWDQCYKTFYGQTRTI
jgi:hypothetical protein